MINKTRASSSITKNIADVSESREEKESLFIRRHSLKLGIPKMSLHRNVHENFSLKANKV